jgi:hypothetical protein
MRSAAPRRWGFGSYSAIGWGTWTNRKTRTPEDDLVLTHLYPPLKGVQRLDAVCEDLSSGIELRLADVSFNAADNELVFLPNTTQLRPIEAATQRVRLIAIEAGTEREIGRYVFNHRRVHD